MTSNERAAMQQALEALHAELEAGTCEEFENAAEKCYEAITALREALDHSGESNEMVAESVVKKSLTTDLMVDALTSILEMDVKGHALRERLQFSTLGRKLLDKANKALATVNKSLTAQEQEPVAVGKVNDQACIDWFEGITDYEAPVGATLYAAPVRTKDLTPHEITALIREGAADGGWQGFAQRVIAADREKNKCMTQHY